MKVSFAKKRYFTGILLNKFGITDQASLDVAEAGAVAKRSAILQLNPLKANFDSENLKGIHSYLFRDVYAWAGQFRTITLAKKGHDHVTTFTPPELIEEQLGKVFGQLADEHFLEGLQRREFARRVAALLSEINRIHPFREGQWPSAAPVRAPTRRESRTQTTFRFGQQRAKYPSQRSVGQG
jgi:cell filamentation protein